MQLQLSFATLLAGVLIAFSTQGAEARPMRRNAGTVSLPLKRVEQRSGDVHPLVYLQQHINRGNKRLARMTGREEPSELELRECLDKRMLSIEDEGSFAKRYNHSNLPPTSFKIRKGKKMGANAAKAKAGKAGKKGAKGAKGAAAGAGAAGAAAGAAGGAAAGAAGTGAGAAGAGAAGNGTAATGVGAAGNGTAAAGTGAAGQGAGQQDTVTKANPPSGNNSLGLDIEAQDVGYLATIQMGTPPQDFLILMDSGSADLWVGSDNCQSSAGGGCGNHQFLGAKASSSFKDSGKAFQVTYGTGAVAGTIVQDNIVVAGLQLQSHVFGTAQEETPDFADDSVPFDGLMGLAQSTLSEQKTLTPVEALAKNGLIADAITSYKIPRLADNKNDGEITFGGIDQTKIDPASLVTFANVNKQGFWEGAMAAVTVDGKDTQLQGRTAILDTGTTLIIAPPNDAVAVHQLIDGAQSDGQGGFVVPCSFNQSVALSFGGTNFAIDPRDIAFAPIDNSGQLCASGISSGNVGGDTEWLVGDVFLKNAYFSTDVGKNQISLAKLV